MINRILITEEERNIEQLMSDTGDPLQPGGLTSEGLADSTLVEEVQTRASALSKRL